MGLDHAADRDAAARAVLEGVTFALRDCRDALAATGTGFASLLATGGGARSDYWLAAIATALNTPVDVPVSGAFGAALGAARLGLMAATGVGAETAPPPPVARRISPDAPTGAFDDAHARWQEARDGLRGIRLD